MFHLIFLLIKSHKKSLGKDFGEVLAVIYVIDHYWNVKIAETESNTCFDLSFIGKDSVENQFNIKSGVGSGQSFKNIQENISLLPSNIYEEGILEQVCLDMIKSILTNEKGRGKRFEILNAAKK